MLLAKLAKIKYTQKSVHYNINKVSVFASSNHQQIQTLNKKAFTKDSNS